VYKEQDPADEYKINQNRSLTLCGMVGQVELPVCETDLRSGHMSFLWRLFLTDLLAIDPMERNQIRRAITQKENEGANGGTSRDGCCTKR